jgi:hypothetical protein
MGSKHMTNVIQSHKPKTYAHVDLEYYDLRGRLCCRGCFNAEFYCDDHGNPFMANVVAKVRGMNQAASSGGMPGLPDGCDSWDGPIRVECQGAARLILPR